MRRCRCRPRRGRSDPVPARATIADLKAKAKALEWACQGAVPGEVDIDREPGNVAALRGLLADIYAMG